MKLKRQDAKLELRALREDKLELEMQRGNLEKESEGLQTRISKLERDRDMQD